MAEYELESHKENLEVFEGAPIPGNDDAEQLPAASEEKSPDDVSVEPPVAEQLLSSSLSSWQTAEPSPQAASSKQPVIAETVVKNSRRTPCWYQCWKQIKNKLFAPKASVDVSRQKKMAMLVSVLFVIFIFVIIRVFKRSLPAATNAQNSVAANTDGSIAVAEEKINWQIPEPYPTTLRDPMRTGLSAGGQGENGDLVVKGIVYSEDRSSAIIDNQIVHQGDKILGTTVVKINRNNVEFEMDGKKWTQEVQQ